MTEFEALAQRFALACLRLAPVIALPALSPFSWAPGLVRVAVLLVLALSLAVLVPGTALTLSQPLELAQALATEALLGLLLAFAVALPSAALSFAGRLVDTQSGFSAANLLNPGRNDAESLLGTALVLSATVLFVTLDLHVQLFALLAQWMVLSPLGAAAYPGAPEPLLRLMGQQFVLGFLITAPITFCMFAIDVGSGYATRSMPQANVYFLALPVKIVAAILVMAVTLPHLPVLIGRMYGESFSAFPQLVVPAP